MTDSILTNLPAGSAVADADLFYTVQGSSKKVTAAQLKTYAQSFSLTPGSVAFAGSSGNIAQDNANFFWDDTLNILQVAKIEVGVGHAQSLTTYPLNAQIIYTANTNTNTFNYGLNGPGTFYGGIFPTANDTWGFGWSLNGVTPLGKSLQWDASGNVYIGDASDVILSRSAAGVLKIPGVPGGGVASLLIQNSDTSSTGIAINNTSTGGKMWEFFSTGQFNSPGQFGIYNDTNGRSGFTVDGTSSALKLISGAPFGWVASASSSLGTPDTWIYKESTGGIALYGGTSLNTPASFWVVNAYSGGGSNYERGVFSWQETSNVLTIGATNGGTGTGRGLNLTTGNGLLSMVGQSLGGTSSGTGFLMSLGYNAVNNKQYWLGDPDYIGNGSSRFIRMASFSGLTYLSGVDGTNSTNLPVVTDVASWLSFGGQTSGNCGINYDVITGPDYSTVAAITGNAGAYADFRAKTLRTSTVAVASLPAAGNKGRCYFVNDANSTTFASIVAGGGTNNIPVYDDGTNWRIG